MRFFTLCDFDKKNRQKKAGLSRICEIAIQLQTVIRVFHLTDKLESRQVTLTIYVSN